MAGDKSVDVSFSEFVKIIKKEPEMPYNISDAALNRLLSSAFNVSDVSELHNRKFNNLYDYGDVLAALELCHFQP